MALFAERYTSPKSGSFGWAMLKHSRIRNSVKLITDKTGAVTGVLVKGKHSGLYQINAKAVVLATGGIGANAKLVQSLRPDISADVKTSNQPGITVPQRTFHWLLPLHTTSGQWKQEHGLIR